MLKTKRQIPIEEGEFQINIFQKKEIRQLFYKKEWWFSIVDIIEAITGSSSPRRYWSDLKKKLSKEGYAEVYEKIVQLRLLASDGKMRKTDCANVESIFRLVQSMTSKKAEPFKRWLAKVGYERIQEYQNPEITVKRAIIAYQLKGYSAEWIKARIGSIHSRRGLTDEWQKRGVEGSFDYAILTDAISIGTFDLTTKKHKEVKKLGSSHQLRDNMTPIELALTILGETSTVKIAQKIDAQGLRENKQAAEEGGDIAGDARKALEKRLGESVVSKQNYLTAQQRHNVIKYEQEQSKKLLKTSEKPLKLKGSFRKNVKKIINTKQKT